MAGGGRLGPCSRRRRSRHPAPHTHSSRRRARSSSRSSSSRAATGACPWRRCGYDVTPTGLHYLLVHFDIPARRCRDLAPAAGRPRRPPARALARRAPRPAAPDPARSRSSARATAGRWLTPAPAQPALARRGDRHGGVDRHAAGGRCSSEAGLRDDAAELVFTGADRGIQGDVEHRLRSAASRSRTRCRPEVLLAYEMNGAAARAAARLPAAPPRARLVRHDEREVAHRRSRRSTEPFDGYQQARRLPLPARRRRSRRSRSRGSASARSWSPPGIPDFFTRRASSSRAASILHGRAWSGRGPIARVEVGVDGALGRRHARARRSATSPGAAGRFDWDAAPGDHELACRATDADGRRRSRCEAPWNYQGMGNNVVQRLQVSVA